jgi:multiple sugar transport system permease protein
MGSRMNILKKNYYSTHEKRWGFILSIPAIVFFLVFMVYPVFNALFLSFFKYDILSTKTFIGIKNYVSLFSDKGFLWSFFVTFLYVFGTALPILIISLVFALILNQAVKGRGLYRTIFYLPSVMSFVAVALIFTGVFNSKGIFNYFISMFRRDMEVIYWLKEMPYALIAIIITRVWRSFGYYMVIFLAGLQGIPSSYYDAAKIDGVSIWQKFALITWPLLSQTTIIVTLLSVVNAFQAFTVPFLMTGGGPAEKTSILPILLYNTGFRYFKMGKAASISVFIVIFISVFAFLQFRINRKYD